LALDIRAPKTARPIRWKTPAGRPARRRRPTARSGRPASASPAPQDRPDLVAAAPATEKCSAAPM